VATALRTGLRRSELRRLRWRDIDFDKKVLIVPKTKSHRPRTVPLSETALTVLREQREVPGNRQHVFPGRDRADHTGMRRLSWWVDALKPLQEALPAFSEREQGSVGRGWHLLRHTFASWLAQRGVSLHKIAEWLGHTDVRMTQIYAHLQPKYDVEIEKLEDMANGSP